MNPAPQQCQIRPMTAADLEGVIEIAQGLPHAPQWPRSAYENALNPESRPQRIVLVTCDAANTLAGFIVAGLTPPDAELETIAVAAKFQRQGLAGQLFEALCAELNLAQVSGVFLEVRASNHAAQAFYRALGFAQTGLRPRYYADPVEDAILMGLDIN